MGTLRHQCSRYPELTVFERRKPNLNTLAISQALGSMLNPKLSEKRMENAPQKSFPKKEYDSYTYIINS